MTAVVSSYNVCLHWRLFLESDKHAHSFRNDSNTGAFQSVVRILALAIRDAPSLTLTSNRICWKWEMHDAVLQQSYRAMLFLSILPCIIMELIRKVRGVNCQKCKFSGRTFFCTEKPTDVILSNNALLDRTRKLATSTTNGFSFNQVPSATKWPPAGCCDTKLHWIVPTRSGNGQEVQR